MKKIAIIGASELQNPLILKAKEMGLETHVFAWKCGDIGENTADYFYPISIVEKEKILQKCKDIKVDAVTTIATDLGNVVASYIAREMGLPSNSEKCVKLSSNKYEMRKAFFNKGVNVPWFFEVSKNGKFVQCEKITYPVIVKPTDRSGSRGVTKVLNEKELGEAIEKAISYSFEQRAIVEEFIEGDEYSMECISYKGKHEMLAVTKKYTTGAPCFIEKGHIEPSGLNSNEVNRARGEVFKALDALEIEMGASHSEFKIDKKGKVTVIEIGSRMGGDHIGSDLVKLSTGYDYVKMVIETSLGMEPNYEKIALTCNAGVKYIFSIDDYNRLLELKNDDNIKIEYISDIEINDSEINDSSGRYGLYILTSDEFKVIRDIIES